MIHTPIYVMIYFIVPVISLPYQLHRHAIIHDVALLDINQDIPHSQMVVPRVTSLPNIGPDRSVMLPEVVGYVSQYLHQATDT